jgi:hypothetical protein
VVPALSNLQYGTYGELILLLAGSASAENVSRVFFVGRERLKSFSARENACQGGSKRQNMYHLKLSSFK